MSLTFYSAPHSSATPVATALAELDLPHELVTFDLTKTEHRKPEFLKLNPNGKVPTLVVDGTPMFECLAILQFLGDRYGVERGLWPAFDSPERLKALSWTTWAYVTYGSAIGRYIVAASPRMPPEFMSPLHADRAKGELDAYLSILDEHLSSSGYVLGDEYSLVDLVLANVVQYGVICGISVEAYSKVTTWLAKCVVRPAIKSGWS